MSVSRVPPALAGPRHDSRRLEQSASSWWQQMLDRVGPGVAEQAPYVATAYTRALSDGEWVFHRHTALTPREALVALRAACETQHGPSYLLDGLQVEATRPGFLPASSAVRA